MKKTITLCDNCKKEKDAFITTSKRVCYLGEGGWEKKDFCSYECYLENLARTEFIKVIDEDFHKGEKTYGWDKENALKFIEGKEKQFLDRMGEFKKSIVEGRLSRN